VHNTVVADMVALVLQVLLQAVQFNMLVVAVAVHHYMFMAHRPG
jgi:hypothetical protein